MTKKWSEWFLRKISFSVGDCLKTHSFSFDILFHICSKLIKLLEILLIHLLPVLFPVPETEGWWLKKVARSCASFVLRDNFVQGWGKPIIYPHQLFEQVPEQHRVRNCICLLYLLVVVFSLLFPEKVLLQETLHILGYQPAPKQCKIVVLKEHILPP